MTSTPRLKFTGKGQPPAERHPDAPSKPEPYTATPELVRAVNLALYLRRPLLLEGEAGCGKTRLAHAVAYELGRPLFTWHVRSTNKAQEGLYSYDAIMRLHDVHTAALEVPATRRRDPGDPTQYRTLGPLGQAFALQDGPGIVLIDEIDKAELDFPNDLLTVLDDPWRFTIPETGETIQAAHKPIVIITSNKEKGNLPAPFLRRCMYYFVEFPESVERLQEIVDLHYVDREAGAAAPDPDLLKRAAERFLKLRGSTIYKKPGTSEFLDWIAALANSAAIFDEPVDLAGDGPLPLPSLLFKLRRDWLDRAALA